MARILLVDDDEGVRWVLERTLARLGHDVVSASDGAQALRVYDQMHERHETPDVILTDIVMPEKEGLETIRELRTRDRDVRIVAMSGGAQLSAGSCLKLAKALGARCSLTKPFSMQELEDAIESAQQ